MLKATKTVAVTVIEAPAYAERADVLLTAAERDEVLRVLATTPDAGDEIKGTGGVRKLRFGAKRQGKGKSGGVRVIYYFYNLTFPVAALRIYAKSEQADLSPKEKADVAREAAELKALAVAQSRRRR